MARTMAKKPMQKILHKKGEEEGVREERGRGREGEEEGVRRDKKKERSKRRE